MLGRRGMSRIHQIIEHEETSLEHRVEQAATLMRCFAKRTGLGGDARPQTRYLWTDALAVCNFIALAHATGERYYGRAALRLVDDVHNTLGKHRKDVHESGWLSGLSASDGAEHPTCAGLRIGKPRAERAPGETFDEALEWERDGQCFHYLTKWMFALTQVARFTGEARYHRWAVELAAVQGARDKAQCDEHREHCTFSCRATRSLTVQLGRWAMDALSPGRLMLSCPLHAVTERKHTC